MLSTAVRLCIAMYIVKRGNKGNTSHELNNELMNIMHVATSAPVTCLSLAKVAS